MGKTWFDDNGYVGYSGVRRIRGWVVDGDRFSLRVSKPVNLEGLPARLTIRLSATPETPEDCAPSLSMAVFEGGPGVWSTPTPGLTVEADLPTALIAAGSFRAAVKISTAAKYGRAARFATCAYLVESVELAPLDSESSLESSQPSPGGR